MRQRHIFQSLLGTMAWVSLLFSCSSEEMGKNEDEGQYPSTIVLSQENEQTVTFNVGYDVVNGYKVIFDVYAENPYTLTSEGLFKKEGIKPIVSAMTDENGRYDITRILPGGVKEVYVTSDCVGVPALLHGIIAAGTVTPTEVDLTTLINQNENAETRAVDFPILYLGDWNYWGRPNYVDKNKSCNISKEELKSITSALPEWRSVNKDYCTAQGIHVEKEAEVWISLLNAKSLFNNALGYYCYKDGMSKDEITEVIALPRTDMSSLLNTGLKSGEYVKLKYYNSETKKLEDKFPAGTNIGWVLHRSGYHALTSTVGKGTYQFYSNSAWNPEKTKNNHTAIFSTKEGNLIVGFEDVPNESILGSDNDCNDVIFHVSAEPADAISTTVEIPSDETKEQVEEEVDVVQPLSCIIDVPALPFWLDLQVASKSRMTVVDEIVTGIEDVFYIANSSAMADMVTRTFETSGFTRKVVVRTTVKLSRAEKEKGRTVVRTTVKDTSWEVEAQQDSRAIVVLGDYDSVQELILAAVRDHADELRAGKYIKVVVTMDFEEGVPYEQFVNSINLPPYSPFIENTSK